MIDAPPVQISLVAAILCATASSVPASADQLARFASFALDRCVMPILAGAPPDSSGLMQDRQKTDDMTQEQLETYESRKVFHAGVEMRLWVPNAGGCSAGTIGLQADDLLELTETWRRQELRLSLVGVTEADGVTVQRYTWSLNERNVPMTVRVALRIPGKRPGFATITMEQEN